MQTVMRQLFQVDDHVTSGADDSAHERARGKQSSDDAARGEGKQAVGSPAKKRRSNA